MASKKLRIAVLARNANLYSHKRLVEAGEQRGHQVTIIDTGKCYMNITAKKPAVHYKGESLAKKFDAIIPRVGASFSFYGASVIRQFEMMGVYTVTGSVPFARSRDKLRSLQLLSRKGIAMPKTAFANSVNEIDDLIKMVGGAPLVVKLLEGTQGRGVVLCDNTKSAKSIITAFKQANMRILVQEFIQEANGKDLRCFVVGNKIVGAFQRTAPEGEFRANLHQGGTADKVELTKEEAKMAIDAAKVMGLHVSGVDLIRSARGPLVLEINSSPGLEGIEKATGKDIAGEIIKFVEKQVKNHKANKEVNA
jgi:ribosomal protein S6--L-glutamate ligase